jgi:DNA-binding MarR family transcriptional regulator
MSPPSAPPGLAAEKAQNLGHLLFRTARLFNELAVARLNRRPGLEALRPAHMQLLPHLDLGGTRPAELARRVGLSRQAVGQLIDDLDALGVLTRVPDPADKRGKLVVFTSQGAAGLREGLAHLAALEAELRAGAGDDVIDALKATLAQTLPVVEGLWAAEAALAEAPGGPPLRN